MNELALFAGMDGLKATGNGWVPPVAARAFVVLAKGGNSESQR